MLTAHEFTALFPFCCLGAGARGCLGVMHRLGPDAARFRNLGGIDLDPESCADFVKLAAALGTWTPGSTSIWGLLDGRTEEGFEAGVGEGAP